MQRRRLMMMQMHHNISMQQQQSGQQLSGLTPAMGVPLQAYPTTASAGSYPMGVLQGIVPAVQGAQGAPVIVAGIPIEGAAETAAQPAVCVQSTALR